MSLLVIATMAVIAIQAPPARADQYAGWNKFWIDLDGDGWYEPCRSPFGIELDSMNVGKIYIGTAEARSGGKWSMSATGDTVEWHSGTSLNQWLKFYLSGNDPCIEMSDSISTYPRGSTTIKYSSFDDVFTLYAGILSHGDISAGSGRFYSNNSWGGVFTTTSAKPLYVMGGNARGTTVLGGTVNDTLSRGHKIDSSLIVGLAVGCTLAEDTIGGYTAVPIVVPSFGVTITGVDTLYKLYGTAGDSFKVVSVSGKASSVSAGGNADTIVFKAAIDSVKVPWGVGLKWLAPAAVNLKSARADTMFVIFRKGATTAAANFFINLFAGFKSGRMF